MENTEKGAVKRLLWFSGLWLAGVAAVGLVGLAVKLLLG
jgi:hypothetical protein